jgi:TonB family protein
MKTSLIIVIAILFLFGCNEKKQTVEVVPNLDELYTPSSDLSTQSKESKEMSKKIENDLIKAVKTLYDKNSGKPMWFKIALRIYLNENGTIDKIKDISSAYPQMEYNSDSVANYPDRSKLNEAVANVMGDWKFSPAQNDGEKVKSREDFRINILMKPNDQYYFDLPDLSELSDQLKNLFSGEDRYFVAVEQMPEIIGGMKALAEKIHYPETAKRAGIEGKVYVKAFIDEQGNVVKTEIVKGIGGGCDQVAVDAVKKVKFTPGKQRGEPVKVQVMIPIVFKLK